MRPRLQRRRVSYRASFAVASFTQAESLRTSKDLSQDFPIHAARLPRGGRPKYGLVLDTGKNICGDAMIAAQAWLDDEWRSDRRFYILSSFDHAQYSLDPQKHSASLVPYNPLGPKN